MTETLVSLSVCLTCTLFPSCVWRAGRRCPDMTPRPGWRRFPAPRWRRRHRRSPAASPSASVGTERNPQEATLEGVRWQTLTAPYHRSQPELITCVLITLRHTEIRQVLLALLFIARATWPTLTKCDTVAAFAPDSTRGSLPGTRQQLGRPVLVRCDDWSSVCWFGFTIVAVAVLVA